MYIQRNNFWLISIRHIFTVVTCCTGYLYFIADILIPYPLGFHQKLLFISVIHLLVRERLQNSAFWQVLLVSGVSFNLSFISHLMNLISLDIFAFTNFLMWNYKQVLRLSTSYPHILYTLWIS